MSCGGWGMSFDDTEDICETCIRGECDDYGCWDEDPCACRNSDHTLKSPKLFYERMLRAVEANKKNKEGTSV